MRIEIKDDIAEEFFCKHTLEAVFIDRNNNEMDRKIIRDCPPVLYIVFFTPITHKGCSKKLAFIKQCTPPRIEKLGVITIEYLFNNIVE